MDENREKCLPSTEIAVLVDASREKLTLSTKRAVSVDASREKLTLSTKRAVSVDAGREKLTLSTKKAILVDTNALLSNYCIFDITDNYGYFVIARLIVVNCFQIIVSLILLTTNKLKRRKLFWL